MTPPAGGFGAATQALHVWNVPTPGCEQVALLGVAPVQGTPEEPPQQGPLPLSYSEIKPCKVYQHPSAAPVGRTLLSLQQKSNIRGNQK